MNPRDMGIYALGLIITVSSMPKGLETTAQQQVQLQQPQSLEQEISQQSGIAKAQPTTQPSSIKVVGATPELEITIRNEIATLPKPLQDALGEIRVVPESKGDAVATATHPSGLTTIWGDGANYFDGAMAHEAAHHLAFKTWGTGEPPKEYESYFLSEGGVTKYGSLDPSEDFAEAVRLFTTGGLQSISPRKHAYIAKLLADR